MAGRITAGRLAKLTSSAAEAPCQCGPVELRRDWSNLRCQASRTVFLRCGTHQPELAGCRFSGHRSERRTRSWDSPSRNRSRRTAIPRVAEWSLRQPAASGQTPGAGRWATHTGRAPNHHSPRYQPRGPTRQSRLPAPAVREREKPDPCPYSARRRPAGRSRRCVRLADLCLSAKGRPDLSFTERS